MKGVGDKLALGCAVKWFGACKFILSIVVAPFIAGTKQKPNPIVPFSFLEGQVLQILA